MLKKTVQYVDFNGNTQSEDLYFNLNEVEAVRLYAKYPDGMEDFIENLDPNERPDEILELFEDILLASYGEKSSDGRHFLKSQEQLELFRQSAAYSALFTEMISDGDQASDFFNSLLTRTTVEVADNGSVPKSAVSRRT